MRRVLLSLSALLIFAACGTADNQELITSDLLPYFREVFPYQEIVLMIEGDANDDGIDDLVVVFAADPNHNQKVTVLSASNGFWLTEPMPAPFQDVAMSWRDIDNAPPIELVLSGRRGMDFGLGVLRFYENQWVDLFGGLEDCC
ncbi:MAG: hypothetical protein FWB98_00175 [Defluviitaleaceae bacterium]|nr:hypothetical protein [Defluviitaleaceae bacterium]